MSESGRWPPPPPTDAPGGWPPPTGAPGGWPPPTDAPVGWPPPPADAQPVYVPNAPLAPPPGAGGTNGLAIASLGSGLVGLFCLAGIASVVALVLGYVALAQIRGSRGSQEGRGLALAGVILGWIGLVITIVGVAAIIAIGMAESGPDDAEGGVTPSGGEDSAEPVELPEPGVTNTTVPLGGGDPALAAEVLDREPPTPAPPAAVGDGLETATLIEGEGPVAVPGDTLIVHYVGVLADGTVFDESWSGGSPFEFRLGDGGVIAGWDEGLVGVRAGERRHLDIGPDKAYGDLEQGSIPANASLAFDVDVVAIAPGG